MKKMIWLISLLFVSISLAACSSNKEEKTAKPAKPKSETVAKKESLDDTVETKTYTYERGTDVKQQGRETITYKGKDIQKVDIQLTQPFDDTTKANLAQQDLQAIKPEVIAAIEQDQTLAQLLGKQGLTVSFDVTENYDLVINMSVDMAKVNFEELKAIENFGYNFAGLENTTPKRYIASLEVRGAEEVKP